MQTQRWLEARGFALPSVYVVQGSRGRIAAALGLDFVIDDRPETCLDIVVDSKARGTRVARREKHCPIPPDVLGIGVREVGRECLAILAQVHAPRPKRRGRGIA